MNEEVDGLTQEEQERYESLAKDMMPPKFLEERIVNVLKEKNFIKSEELKQLNRFIRIGLAFASAVILLVLGAAVGAILFSNAENTANSVDENRAREKNEYVLLLRSSPEKPRETSPETIRQSVLEYSAWARKTAEQGHLLQGEKLKDEAKMLSRVNGNLEIAGEEPDEAKKMVEGFFVIKAETYQQAVEIAKDCPHLKYGGKIEVREIEKLR